MGVRIDKPVPCGPATSTGHYVLLGKYLDKPILILLHNPNS